ncbi:MAG: hypothetical protein U5L04_08690 [Trueperaceae bacterium]|nr:hypothetical protein [Trueperaceae bacterium]
MSIALEKVLFKYKAFVMSGICIFMRAQRRLVRAGELLPERICRPGRDATSEEVVVLCPDRRPNQQGEGDGVPVVGVTRDASLRFIGKM